jgi:hypothetical protein
LKAEFTDASSDFLNRARAKTRRFPIAANQLTDRGTEQ